MSLYLSHTDQCNLKFLSLHIRAGDRSIDIATHHGLEVPGIESRWGENIRTRPDQTWDPTSLLYNGY
jgi:hypothetical protein